MVTVNHGPWYLCWPLWSGTWKLKGLVLTTTLALVAVKKVEAKGGRCCQSPQGRYRHKGVQKILPAKGWDWKKIVHGGNSLPRWMDEMWWFELTRQFLQESSGVPSVSWVGLASKENIPGGFLFPLPTIVVKQNSSPSVPHLFGFLFLMYWSLKQLFKVCQGI